MTLFHKIIAFCIEKRHSCRLAATYKIQTRDIHYFLTWSEIIFVGNMHKNLLLLALVRGSGCPPGIAL